MKFLIVIPTKSPSDPLVIEGLSYLKKLRAPFLCKADMFNPKISPSASMTLRKELEGRDLLAKTEGYFRIALSENGTQYSSESFSKLVEKLTHKPQKIAFIVGGAFGLSRQVIDASDKTLSLSLLTMPHRMAFLVLAEQLYRSSEIIANSPYHK